jgi:NAD+--dinitrogen-reductase ADP-D-ribosyltransferase
VIEEEPVFLPNAFSRCNHSPWVLASVEFQENPKPVRIGRVRENAQRLFDRLDAEENPARRGEIFHEFASVQFSLHQWKEQSNPSARSCLRNSYVRFLRGWQVDSNSVEGAVLKGWVHGRFGLEPSYHKGPLSNSSATMVYAVDRIRGSTRTNAIDSQFDLLFEFCQYELARRWPDESALTLYRGTYDAASYELKADGQKDVFLARMNNISSFTSDQECAWEFGSTVWEVKIPKAKIFFFSGLLPDSLLHGESEYLVIGGEFRVKRLWH